MMSSGLTTRQPMRVICIMGCETCNAQTPVTMKKEKWNGAEKANTFIVYSALKVIKTACNKTTVIRRQVNCIMFLRTC